MRTALLTASLLIGLVACERAPAPTPSSAAQAVAEPQAPARSPLSPSGQAICRLAWNCEATNVWYASRTACFAACTSGTCFQDAHCVPGCVCP
jgi:hypothetical protein